MAAEGTEPSDFSQPFGPTRGSGLAAAQITLGRAVAAAGERSRGLRLQGMVISSQGKLLEVRSV